MHKRIKIILNWAISEHTAGPIVNCHVIWPKDDFVLNKPEFNTIINLQYNFTQACFKHNDDSELFSANETPYIKVKNYIMALGPVVLRLVKIQTSVDRIQVAARLASFGFYLQKVLAGQEWGKNGHIYDHISVSKF